MPKYLAENGQLLLPLVELLEASGLAVDELIDVLGQRILSRSGRAELVRTVPAPPWSYWRAPQGQVVGHNAGSAEGRARTLSQCPSHLRFSLSCSIADLPAG
jgi:hypothetical protein